MTSTFFPQTINLADSAVQEIETSLNNPRVVLDSGGLRGYDSNGNVTIDVDADNGTFTGKAEQISGPLSMSAYPGDIRTSLPQPSNSVSWYEEGGALVALIGGSYDSSGDAIALLSARAKPTTGSDNYSSARVRAYDTNGNSVAEIYTSSSLDKDYMSVVQVKGSGQNAQSGIQVESLGGLDTVSVFSNGVTTRLADSNGNSQLLKLLNNANYQVAVESLIFTFTSSTPDSPAYYVTNPIGRVPVFYAAFPDGGGNSGVDCYATSHGSGQATATVLAFTCHTVTRQNAVAGSTVPFKILVIG